MTVLLLIRIRRWYCSTSRFDSNCFSQLVQGTEYSRLTAAVVPLYLVSNIGAVLVEFVLWELRNSPLATHSYSFVIYLWSSRFVNLRS